MAFLHVVSSFSSSSFFFFSPLFIFKIIKKNNGGRLLLFLFVCFMSPAGNGVELHDGFLFLIRNKKRKKS